MKRWIVILFMVFSVNVVTVIPADACAPWCWPRVEDIVQDIGKDPLP